MTGLIAANWSGGNGSNFPNAQDDVAVVTSALTGAETINLNQAITVGTLDIGASTGTNAFIIAPNGGSLTLSVSSGSATVAKNSGGADQITAPLTFSSNVIFDNSLSAPNTLSITGTATGAKTVTVNSPTTNTGEVDFTAANALNGDDRHHRRCGHSRNQQHHPHQRPSAHHRLGSVREFKRGNSDNRQWQQHL